MFAILNAILLIVFPLVATHRAIAQSPEKLAFWAKYWVVITVYSQIERILSPLVSLIPLYELLKCILLVWFVLSNHQEVVIQYDTFIVPCLTTFGLVKVEEPQGWMGYMSKFYEQTATSNFLGGMSIPSAQSLATLTNQFSATQKSKSESESKTKTKPQPEPQPEEFEIIS